MLRGFILALLVLGTLGFYQGTDVIELTSANFAQTVFSNEHVWLVEFYAPWCGHCKNLKPTWEKLATQLKGIVKVAAVDCDKYKEIAGQFGVQGFPTIKLFPSTIKQAGKGFKKEPIDYNGGRELAALAQFATGHLPNFATAVNSENHQQFLDKEKELNKVLLFSEKSKTTDLYKALSVDFHHRLTLGEVKSKDPLAAQYKVESFPTLLVVPKDGGEPTVYQGKLSHAALYSFLEPFAAPAPAGSASGSAPTPAPPAEKKLVELKHITKQSDFDELCGSIKGSCVITALDTEAAEHQQHLKTLAKLNSDLQGQYRFAWVDAKKQTQFVDEMRLHSGFPAVTLVNAGKKYAMVYIGVFEEARLAKWLGKTRSTNSFPLETLPVFVTE